MGPVELPSSFFYMFAFLFLSLHLYCPLFAPSSLRSLLLFIQFITRTFSAFSYNCLLKMDNKNKKAIGGGTKGRRVEIYRPRAWREDRRLDERHGPFSPKDLTLFSYGLWCREVMPSCFLSQGWSGGKKRTLLSTRSVGSSSLRMAAKGGQKKRKRHVPSAPPGRSGHLRT